MLKLFPGASNYFAVPEFFASGTVAAPAIAFTDNTDVGWYYTTDQINVSVNGTLRLSVSALGAVVPYNGSFLYGNAPIATYAADQTLTAAQCQGGFVTATATATFTLPGVDAAATGLCVTVYSTTAAVVHVKANASDRIVLNGTALDDGDKISCDAVAGNFVTLVNDAVTGWRTVGMAGVWSDGGA